MSTDRLVYLTHSYYRQRLEKEKKYEALNDKKGPFVDVTTGHSPKQCVLYSTEEGESGRGIKLVKRVRKGSWPE